MIPRRSSGQLYTVLEIEKTASPEDIKKAYRKKALQVHPDKTGGTTTEEFKQVQEANAILSDPEKRKLYDTFGRSGMAQMEQYGVGGAAAQMMEHPFAIRILAFIAWFAVSLLLIFVSLYVVKVDAPKSWSWVAVFSPIWILSVFIIPIGAFLALSGARTRRFDQLFTGIGVIMFIVVCIVYAKTMNGDVEWKTFFTYALITLSILYVGELLGLRLSVVQEVLAAQGHPAATQEGGVTVTSPVYIRMVIQSLFNMICILVFTCLMRDRLVNESSSLNFYEVFTPLYIRYSLPALFSFAISVKSSNVTLRQGICLFIVTLLALAAVLYTYVMISIKLQKEWLDGDKGPSAAVCAIMIFIALGICTLLTCCGCCCSTRPQEEGYADIYRAAENGADPEASATDVSGNETGVPPAAPKSSAPTPSSPANEPKEPTTYYNSLD